MENNMKAKVITEQSNLPHPMLDKVGVYVARDYKIAQVLGSLKLAQELLEDYDKLLIQKNREDFNGVDVDKEIQNDIGKGNLVECRLNRILTQTPRYKFVKRYQIKKAIKLAKRLKNKQLRSERAEQRALELLKTWKKPGAKPPVEEIAKSIKALSELGFKK